jgi:hypothetical protein
VARWELLRAQPISSHVRPRLLGPRRVERPAPRSVDPGRAARREGEGAIATGQEAAVATRAERSTPIGVGPWRGEACRPSAPRSRRVVMSTLGASCGYELRTTDLNAARAFHAVVAGGHVAPSGDSSLFLHAGESRVGGLVQLPERARARGAPAHSTWAEPFGCLPPHVKPSGGRMRRSVLPASGARDPQNGIPEHE